MKANFTKLSEYLFPEGIVNARVLVRFPVPVLLMALFTFYVIFNEYPFGSIHSTLFLALIVAAYGCVSVVLAFEQLSVKSLWLKILTQLFVASVICLLGWYSRQWQVNVWYLLLAALLMLGNAPFRMCVIQFFCGALPGRDTETAAINKSNFAVWDFTHRIWVAAIFATAGSIVFFLGVQAIREAMQQLFSVEVHAITDRLLLPLGLCFLAPLYWLASIPEPAEVREFTNSIDTAQNSVSRAIAFMGSWLLAPLMLAYAAILVAYAVRILLLGNLPDGEVAQLSFPFLVLGTLTWLLFEPSFARQNRIAKFYRTIWFFIAMPVAVLLALAVWQRIAAYGLTTQRIALMLCSIWSLLVSLCFTLGKPAWRDIRLIPGLASILMILCGLIGGQLSYFQQQSIARANLYAAGVLDDNRKFKRYSDIEISDTQAAVRGKEALLYLLQRDSEHIISTLTHSENLVKDDLLLTTSLLHDSKLGHSIDLPPMYSHEAEHKLMERLKLDAYNKDTTQGFSFEYTRQPDTAVDIAGYETLYSGLFIGPGFSDIVLPGTALKLQVKGAVVSLQEADATLAEMDFRAWALAQPSEGRDLDLKDPVVVLYDNGGRAVGLLLQFIHIPQSNQDEFVPLQFDVLLKGF